MKAGKKKLNANINAPIPQTVGKLCSFLGLVHLSLNQGLCHYCSPSSGFDEKVNQMGMEF